MEPFNVTIIHLYRCALYPVLNIFHILIMREENIKKQHASTEFAERLVYLYSDLS